MTRKEIEDIVVEVIKNKFSKALEINSETDIVKELGADSLDEIEITMDLENKFNCSLPDDFISLETSTIKEIVDKLIKSLPNISNIKQHE